MPQDKTRQEWRIFCLVLQIYGFSLVLSCSNLQEKIYLLSCAISAREKKFLPCLACSCTLTIKFFKSVKWISFIHLINSREPSLQNKMEILRHLALRVSLAPLCLIFLMINPLIYYRSLPIPTESHFSASVCQHIHAQFERPERLVGLFSSESGRRLVLFILPLLIRDQSGVTWPTQRSIQSV